MIATGGSNRDARRTPGALQAASAAGLASAAALWLWGRVTTPPPEALAALAATALLLGFGLTLVAARESPAQRATRRAAGVAGLVTLAAPVAFVAGLFAVGEGPVPIRPAPVDGGRFQGRLRLVDLNVLHGYPRLRGQEERYARLARALRALDADVVVLQEAWSTTRHGELARRLAADLGMGAAYARANGSRRLIGFEEGSAVLSRLPILAARRVVLAPAEPIWETRIALFVTLALAGSEPLTVVGTHLAAGSPEVADAQARDLASRLPAGFVLVAGDLNAASDSAAAAALAARGLVDLVPGGIDHVFMRAAPRPWRLHHAGWTLRAEGISDHPAIVVDLTVSRDAS